MTMTYRWKGLRSFGSGMFRLKDSDCTYIKSTEHDKVRFRTSYSHKSPFLPRTMLEGKKLKTKAS